MRVALVHDWLTGMRGGERVLERIARLFPDAPIFTLVWTRGSVSPAIERFDLSGFDAVISTSHAVAKGAPTPAATFHFSYVFTPMRYVWDLEAQYFPPGRFAWPLSGYVRDTCARLRRWDAATSGRPDVVATLSRHIAERIRRHWGRTAEVIHPPVEIARFRPARGPRSYYLVAGAFAPYKRVEVAIEACRRLGRKLVVAGSGQETARLRALAGGDVEFRDGWQSEEDVAALYAGARALLYPGEEDFGIMPVEAMAAGCPVIAYGVGGARETIGRGLDEAALAPLAGGHPVIAPGGVLFAEQTPESLAEAVLAFEDARFDPDELHERTRPFAPPRFDAELLEAFERGHDAWRAGRTPRRAAG